MCGGTPSVQRRDIRAEKLEADRESTVKANAEIASRRSRRAASSLISNAGGAGGLGSSAISVRPGSDNLG